MINLHISFLFTSCFLEAFGVHCQGLGLGNFQLLSVQFLFVLTPWKVVFTLVSAMFRSQTYHGRRWITLNPLLEILA